MQFCAQLTVTTCSCYYQFPCFLYNKMFSRPSPPPGKKSKRYPAVYRRTHRQRDTYPPCGDRGGCNDGFASSIHMIPEMYVAFPLPLHLPQPLGHCCYLFPYRTHRTFLQMTGIIIACPLWITIRQEFIYQFVYLFIPTLFEKE